MTNIAENKKLKTNWRYLLIVVVIAFIIGGGILGYQYWLIQKEIETIPEIKIIKKEFTETPSEELTEFPKKYTDEFGIQWEVFGKYEVTEKDNNIIIRNYNTHQEIIRLPRNIQQLAKEELGIVTSGQIRYYPINDKLNKAYLFVGEADKSGARFPLISWTIFQLDLRDESLGKFSLFIEEKEFYEQFRENFKFSPNGRYVSYTAILRTWPTDCPFPGERIRIYDLLSKDMKYEIISPPELLIKYNGYTGPYKWIDDTTIEFNFYLYECEEILKIPKVFSQEIWRYNVVTGDYARIKDESKE